MADHEKSLCVPGHPSLTDDTFTTNMHKSTCPSVDDRANVDYNTGEQSASISAENVRLKLTKKAEDGSSGDGGGDGEDGEAAQYPSSRNLTIVVVSLMLATLLSALDMTIVATAIPKITDDFHGLNMEPWYGSAYFMCVGGSQATWGKMYKYFPLKSTFLAAVLVFVAGSALCGAAPKAVALIVGRALAGISAAGILLGVYTIVAYAARPAKRPLLIGIMGGTYGTSAVVAPVVGGAFSDSVSWRWCFYINLPIGGLVMASILFFFHTPPTAKPEQAPLATKLWNTDPVGMLLLMAAIICFILGMQWGGERKAWDSADVIALLVMSSVIALLFAGWTVWQGERAMLPVRLLRQRCVWSSALFAFNIAGGYFVTLYYLPVYFQSIDGVSPIGSGVRNLPIVLGVIVSSVLSGALFGRFGYPLVFMAVSAVLACISAGLIYTLDIGSGPSKWIGYQVLAGLGYGFGWQVPVCYTQSTVDLEDVAAGTAAVLCFQTVGGALYNSAAQSAFINRIIVRLAETAPTVSPSLVVNTGATELRSVFSGEDLAGVLVAYMDGLHKAFVLAIVGSGLAFLAALTSQRTRVQQTGGAVGSGGLA